jgi:predicted membrane channel-forming protein YqfA (hemolysin III family)
MIEGCQAILWKGQKQKTVRTEGIVICYQVCHLVVSSVYHLLFNMILSTTTVFYCVEDSGLNIVIAKTVVAPQYGALYNCMTLMIYKVTHIINFILLLSAIFKVSKKILKWSLYVSLLYLPHTV